MNLATFFLFVFFNILIFFNQKNSADAFHQFRIDYNSNTFLKDGQPFRYIAGTLHYFQIPRELWRDRMLRVRALGCNALQTYVLWSRHQPTDENKFDFTNDANLTEYLSLAQELGFIVILRAGPYIDAEMDFGGFPYWLLKMKNLILRSSQDNRYLNAVERWLNYLLPNIVKPFLYKNNGPIVTVQIENEYGSYPACDKKYMFWLKNLAEKHLGNDTILFTTDGADKGYVSCGSVDGVFPTIDFGTRSKKDVDSGFTMLRQFVPLGPLVNSEFYPGWLDKWGNKKHATTPIDDVLNTMQSMWDWNVTSFTIYPVHGGSNWGFEAGSLAGPPFQGVTTGYDFDAPISESGDTTPKFLAMRKLIEKFFGRKNLYPIPESPPKYGYGRFRMEWMGTITDLLYAVTPSNRIVKSVYPLTMEDLDQAYGFVLYETVIPKSTGRLEVKGIRDRGYVIINGQLAEVIQRSTKRMTSTIIRLSKFQAPEFSMENGAKVQILVENQGRICYGPEIDDPKGLIDNLTLNDQIITNWTMYPIDLSLIYKIDSSKFQELIENRSEKTPLDRSKKYLPSIYYGYFFADPKAGDTFFDPSQWGKGQLFINGRNIGRYWPQAGPQITLYVPGVYLSQGQEFNQIYVLELDQPGLCETDENFGCWAEFVNQTKYVK